MSLDEVVSISTLLEVLEHSIELVEDTFRIFSSYRYEVGSRFNVNGVDYIVASSPIASNSSLYESTLVPYNPVYEQIFAKKICTEDLQSLLVSKPKDRQRNNKPYWRRSRW